MERLLDALHWAQAALPGYGVERCHPTTGSTAVAGRKGTDDHDLVLVRPDGDKAKFEVSDIVGSQDSNRKEQKDLLSLGVPLTASGEASTMWPQGRLFLIVSTEFAGGLLRRDQHRSRKPDAFFRYESVFTGDRTSILEVLLGPGADSTAGQTPRFPARRSL